MSRRLRLSLIITAGIVLALVLAAFIAVRVLLQPERFTDMLRNAAGAAGLQLTLGAPAEPTLWPRPAVVLHDLTLSVKGRPLLLASQVRLVVPWHVLLGGPATITQLQLQSPRLDIGAVPSALAQLPSSSGGVPGLPRIETGVVVDDGALVNADRVLLDHIHLTTGTLAPDQPFTVNASARTANGRDYRFGLNMTPRTGNGALRFDDVRLQADSAPDTRASLQGNARWNGGTHLQMSLDGTLQRHADNVYKLSLHLLPAPTDKRMLLALRILGNNVNVDLRLPPLQIAPWWNQVVNAKGNALPLPPIDGHAEVATMDLGGVHVEGLQIRAGGALPAVASSAAIAPVVTPR